MTSQFVPTVTNMVTIVRNIIEGYGMGPIRALAQEPVQNSKDAARGHAQVEYRLYQRPLLDGTRAYMLTVTDSNTTGLRGPALTLDEIQARGNVLRADENWAAFEGMGYTKEDDAALGSRGQGKAAFLYHSALPRVASSQQDRMMILYDTLLSDGTYRLGVRYASPFDTVLTPPFSAEEARRIVSSHYTSADGTDIQLGLEPLTQVGTRVIVPHLSHEALEAFQSGELHSWLQRCWWRAIQVGMSISLVDEDGIRQAVSVPEWWESEPWRRSTPRVRTYENVDVAGLKIKRIVLLYDESLNEPDIEGASAQFWGVQLLRGQQWIETLGTETLSDYVPRDKRPGFRGFVEFDQASEPELRRAESSQHERFDRRSSGIRPMLSVIVSKVEEFATEQGWGTQESIRQAPEAERDAAMEFLRFLNPRTRSPRGDRGRASAPSQLLPGLSERWSCELHLEYPDSRSTRVNRGQYIRNLEVITRLEPPASKRAVVSLELMKADESESRTLVASREVEWRNGEGIARFGDYQVINGTPTQGKLQCARDGKWRLVARVEASGVQVAQASRSMFVNEDPPERHSKPYTISISVENHSTGQRRINSGDTVGVQISVTNHTAESQTLQLTASLGDLLLADMAPVVTQGIPAGATPSRVPGVQGPHYS
ncbi:MAG: hypothetical protein F4045_11485 [Chloroflexi bacterium]|nr:hypothetical protein [Chloroflexota bacterium]MYK35693.1 hypothetical protein [Chloroflexota bacterium]